MARKNERFIKIYSENLGSEMIYVDKKTGVNYLFIQSGYAGGLTPLLNPDGTPIITPIPNEYDD
jgi:hypothetical protein